VVERQLPKLNVAGSIPVSRSNESLNYRIQPSQNSQNNMQTPSHWRLESRRRLTLARYRLPGQEGHHPQGHGRHSHRGEDGGLVRRH
jgi:hypothetical protein